MEPAAKGTVTPLASLFSSEEAWKAARVVEEKIGEKREEMNRLEQFVDDNANLINLVKKLPDQLHHDIMVPFGKMAFFPGRLIHTNECMVLLGENYYSDRTSKQTVDVLRRRDKTLKSQIHDLKAEIDDLQTEATFFTSTASEAAEGLVEIREEYVEEEDSEEEDSSAIVHQTDDEEPSGLPARGDVKDGAEDDEFARIMSRLNELEIEEQEDEDGEESGEEQDSPIESGEETEDETGNELIGGVGHNRIEHEESAAELEATISVPKKVSDHSASIRGPRFSEPRVEDKVIEVLPEKHRDDPFTCIRPETQFLEKEDQSRGGLPQRNAGTWRDVQATSTLSRGKETTNIVGPQKIESPIQEPKPKFDGHKAFTGSIVEHAHNLETSTQGQTQSSGAQPSKPVSRFKAQRR